MAQNAVFPVLMIALLHEALSPRFRRSSSASMAKVFNLLKPEFDSSVNSIRMIKATPRSL